MVGVLEFGTLSLGLDLMPRIGGVVCSRGGQRGRSRRPIGLEALHVAQRCLARGASVSRSVQSTQDTSRVLFVVFEMPSSEHSLFLSPLSR